MHICSTQNKGNNLKQSEAKLIPSAGILEKFRNFKIK